MSAIWCLLGSIDLSVSISLGNVSNGMTLWRGWQRLAGCSLDAQGCRPDA